MVSIKQIEEAEAVHFVLIKIKVMLTNETLLGSFRPLFCRRVGKSESGKGIVGNCPGVNTLWLCVIQKMDFLDKSDILQLAHLNVTCYLFTSVL